MRGLVALTGREYRRGFNSRGTVSRLNIYRNRDKEPTTLSFLSPLGSISLGKSIFRGGRVGRPRAGSSNSWTWGCAFNFNPLEQHDRSPTRTRGFVLPSTTDACRLLSTRTRTHRVTGCVHTWCPNLFNPIKEPRGESSRRLLGQLELTRVFVSSRSTSRLAMEGVRGEAKPDTRRD